MKLMIALFTWTEEDVETKNISKDTEEIVNTGWEDSALEQKVVATYIEPLKLRAIWNMI